MHTWPLFYCCYLLKSELTRNTYVGSTNNPLKRLRQHNGEIASGAHKTASGRPWNVCRIVFRYFVEFFVDFFLKKQIVCFVYGFPSIVSALQFEWAWQNPNIIFKAQKNEKNQHDNQIINNTTQHVFPRRQGVRTSLKTRVYVLYSMLIMNIWKNWPLKIKIFDQRVWKLWEEFHSSTSVKISPWMKPECDIFFNDRENIKKNTNLKTNDPISIERKRILYPGEIGDKRYSVLREIDISQNKMSQIAFEILRKIKEKNINLCMVCKGACDLPELDSEDAALKYSQLIICPTQNCLSSETENNILIDSYVCFSCKKSIIWGDCIRLQYCILRKTNTYSENVSAS
ncbi:unnamed protein product [Pneumocystis jirovecii]|uniref:GIY-YIG domain-containing protein n=1 Tax=Pneumocystis jirovecii TaxID=42068 RepID=L0PF64_PNEJI|nr:unnamed protein product [Pneumocystis jirovecii]